MRVRASIRTDNRLVTLHHAVDRDTGAPIDTGPINGGAGMQAYRGRVLVDVAVEGGGQDWTPAFLGKVNDKDVRVPMRRPEGTQMVFKAFSLKLIGYAESFDRTQTLTFEYEPRGDGNGVVPMDVERFWRA
ncbi:MAG: hypothetical protein JSS51_03590 [Planctomycetes bacterium]|nr:hypothetical protein [Planctomycetota bacterium]